MHPSILLTACLRQVILLRWDLVRGLDAADVTQLLGRIKELFLACVGTYAYVHERVSEDTSERRECVTQQLFSVGGGAFMY